MMWMDLVGLSSACSYQELDWQLAEYLEFLLETGQKYNLAGDTLSGISHHADAKRRLPFSWRLLGAWKKQEIPVRAPPMSRLMAHAIAGAALRENDA